MDFTDDFMSNPRKNLEFYFSNSSYSNDLILFSSIKFEKNKPSQVSIIYFDRKTRNEFRSLINKYFSWAKKASKMNAELERKILAQINVKVGLFYKDEWFNSTDKAGQITAYMNYSNDSGDIWFEIDEYKFTGKTNIKIKSFGFYAFEDDLIELKNNLSERRIKKWRDSFK